MPAGRAGQIVVTPHSGEMAKFLDVPREEVDDAPLRAARQAATALQAVVAMKGASTHIVSPDGEAWLSDNGSIGLATSGSGDTLAGILAAACQSNAPGAGNHLGRLHAWGGRAPPRKEERHVRPVGAGDPR